MKVKELIEKLTTMNKEAEVFHLWDGELRSKISHVYMGKNGACVTADYGVVAYSDNSRPVDAPPSREERHWRTPNAVVSLRCRPCGMR